MFGAYVVRRTLTGLLMYVVMVFVYSALFNDVADRTLRSQVEEQVQQEVSRLKGVTPAQLQAVIAEKRRDRLAGYHLDEPLAPRIFWRALRTLAFDFGNAVTLKASDGDRLVTAVILEALPRTILLFSTQVVLTTLLGVALGLRMAQRPGGPLDRLSSSLTMVTNGLPSWWLGMIAIMVFSYGIPLFPSGGLHANPVPTGIAGPLDLMWHLALPLLTLVALGVWPTGYLTRNIVLSTLQEDFVMAARARGISERRVLFGHTQRTSLPAIVTLAVLGLFASVAGNIIVEGIFGWPGIGKLYFVAVEQNDVPVLMATLSFETFVNMLGFILLDLAYGFLDPRIRTGGRP